LYTAKIENLNKNDQRNKVIIPANIAFRARDPKTERKIAFPIDGVSVLSFSRDSSNKE
jgi:hypothetical protein